MAIASRTGRQLEGRSEGASSLNLLGECESIKRISVEVEEEGARSFLSLRYESFGVVARRELSG